MHKEIRPKDGIIIYFHSDVPPEQMEEIVTSLGCTLGDIPLRGGARFVQTPVGEEETLLAQFSNLPEVLNARINFRQTPE